MSYSRTRQYKEHKRRNPQTPQFNIEGKHFDLTLLESLINGTIQMTEVVKDLLTGLNATAAIIASLAAKGSTAIEQQKVLRVRTEDLQDNRHLGFTMNIGLDEPKGDNNG